MISLASAGVAQARVRSGGDEPRASGSARRARFRPALVRHRDPRPRDQRPSQPRPPGNRDDRALLRRPARASGVSDVACDFLLGLEGTTPEGMLAEMDTVLRALPPGLARRLHAHPHAQLRRTPLRRLVGGVLGTPQALRADHPGGPARSSPRATTTRCAPAPGTT